MLSISVLSPPTATLDDIVSALAGSGITAANLSGSSVGNMTQSLWYVTLPTPLAHLKDTIASLTTLQQTIAQKNTQLRLTFSAQGAQVSPQLEQSQQCMVADLVADARTQAQKLAVASGLTLGPIVAITEGPSVGRASAVSTSFAGSIIPEQVFLDRSVRVPLPVPTSPALTCSITVKFALLRYQ